MGTRGFIGFVIGGVEKIGYVHWDAYPDGLGLSVLTWLAEVKDFAAVAESASALRVVATESVPTDEDVEWLKPWTRKDVGNQTDREWYNLLRGTQGDPAKILEAGYIEDGSGFPLDSLFAEWGYIVDFDEGTFEAYKGFRKTPTETGRWAGRDGTESGYHPVERVGLWPLAELPTATDFVNALEPSDV